MADRATGPPGGESSRQGAGYYTPRISSPPTEPPAIQPKETLYLGLPSLSEGPDDEMSGISFDLNELLYARPDSEITARAMVRDFLDAKCRGLRDYDLWSLFRHAFSRWDWTSFTMTGDNTGRGLKFATLIGLREHLLSKGVWCPSKQRGYANRMVKLLNDEQQHQWTLQEIKEQQATPLGLDSRWTVENLTDDDDDDITPQPPLPSRSPKGKEKETSGRKEEREEIRRLREEFLREKSDMERSMEAMARQMAELRTYAIQSNEELRRSTSATRQNLRAFRTKSALTRDSVQISVPNLNNPRGGSSTLGRTGKLPTPLKRPRINKRETRGMGIAKNAPRAGDPNGPGDPDDDRRKGNGGDWQGDRGYGYGGGRNGPPGPPRGFGNGPLRDPGFGNEPLRDPGRGRTTGNYIGNPLPIRPLARQSTLAYGTLGAPDDDGDDFLELGAADPHPRAKELALFARSFPKELNRYGLTSDDYLAAFLIMLTGEAITFYYNHVIKARLLTFKANAIAVRDHFETDHRRQAKYDRWEEISLDLVRKENPGTSLSECFEKLAKELRGIQGSLRPGLRDDRSLANKLYSACKNVPETTIARMNPAFTSTAAVADIRRAIAFATETSRPPAKARAYASSSEPHDHTCSHNTSEADSDLDEEYECKKAAKATTEGEKRCFVCKKPGCWSTNHTLDERKASVAKFQASKDAKRGLPLVSTEEFDQFIAGLLDEPLESGSYANISEGFVTTYGTFDADEVYKQLEIQTAFYAFTSQIETQNVPAGKAETYMASRYSENVFMGLMIDSGAANFSTAGLPQLRALQKRYLEVQLDTSRAGEKSVKYGIGSATSIGAVTLQTPLGQVEFHVVESDVPFLFSLADMDKHKVILDNLRNVLVQGKREIPVVRMFGHVWMLLSKEHAATYYSTEGETVYCHLTEEQLRTIHKRFGHPSAGRFAAVLKRAGHEFRRDLLYNIQKFCHHCQVFGRSPGRFSIKLKDDTDFNDTVYVDVMHLDGKNVLHVVCDSTNFQAATFFKSMSAQHLLEGFSRCWVNTYVGPLTNVVHDPGTNFNSVTFRGYLKGIGSTLKQMPVEAYHSVGLVERYHVPVRRAFEIVTKELLKAPREDRLQMAIKAINDTAGPNSLVPTLLVFGTLPRLTEQDRLAASTQERAAAINKAMREVRKCHAARQVKDALKRRNGPITEHTLDLPIGSRLPEELQVLEVEVEEEVEEDQSEGEKELELRNSPKPQKSLNPPRSLNLRSSPRSANSPPQLKYDPSIPTVLDKEEDDSYVLFTKDSEVLVTDKERRDHELSAKLRAEGVIKSPGAPFQESRAKELAGLIAQGILQVIPGTDLRAKGARIFGSRFVDEIKGKGTPTLYEKSRIVCGKDITQAYTQSGTKLIRIIVVRPLKEITYRFPPGTLFLMTGPLYGIPEAGTHWYKRFSGHFTNNLGMRQSSFDSCLFVSTNKDQLGIAALQTDDVLMVVNPAMRAKEERELVKSKLRSKEIETLTHAEPMIFNGCKLSLDKDGFGLSVGQKGQGERLAVIKLDSATRAKEYLEQRARGAYLATICYPEASCALSMAAQHQEPRDEDYKALNKVIQWLIDHPTRGIHYVPLDLRTAKLFVFVDRAFANNADLSSQIGFVAILGNEAHKCKRVTRAVLASELYAMSLGIDMAIAMSTTFAQITAQLRILNFLVVVCTDSYSLYECIVKLGTTKEKRLMIDIMAIRESYERRELSEVR
ncbi:polyprotein [Drepanopeziza brunnea f. sp. 'multigermtubi' MB_m1]|uniref:Polyprotein n=1 Tax=Marssonina brunnea f. sp. multigermtubi (strain MB_m1) TaxID=1072389 RepID=K1WZZ4_MARBU|nr:polyprotein [Drepanopeziza brunnea f. sp. 'multigermtubi' MB_m1]EKD14183.1 polyprotein [Drepanopeziza brunnea f. sp. 'multigermtubi' MB_m1]